MVSNTQLSKKITAQWAGTYFLITAALSAFFNLYVRTFFFKDFSFPYAEIIVKEKDFFLRSGIWCNMISQVFFVLLAIKLYQLFEGIDSFLQKTLLTSAIIASALTCTSCVIYFALIENISSISPETAALFLSFANLAQGAIETFWTPFFLCMGLLFIKSNFMPKLIGLFQILASAIYAINVFLGLVLPSLHYNEVSLIAMVGGSLAVLPTIFWLITKGICIKKFS